MHRHVAALAQVLVVREQLAHEVLNLEAALLQDAGLAVLCEDDIGRFQRGRRADGDALLAGRDHVEADAALPLGVEHDQVHDADREHALVPRCDFVAADIERPLLIDDLAIRVHDPVGGDCLLQRRSGEVHLGYELAIHRSRELQALCAQSLGDGRGPSPRSASAMTIKPSRGKPHVLSERQSHSCKCIME